MSDGPVKSFADLATYVPALWRKVPIAIGSGYDACEPIVRVALHDNADGSRVVLVYTHPVKIPPVFADDAAGGGG